MLLKDTFEIFSQIRANDVLDILIMSVLIFTAFRMLHKNVHRRVLFVFFAIAALYLTARTYQWQLTLRFIEVMTFSVSVGSVLIFQEDIRRFLESSLFSPFSRSDDEMRSDGWVKAILRSVETFSKNEVGALIVLQRKVPISHIVRSGHRLNGEVSFPLLCSLFDPHSAGHDGAVILKGSRVTRFGAHLPLSRKHEATGRMGTRHAAALGLSEISDAVIVVVSEETGDIGIAEAGTFKKIDMNRLERRLTELNEIESHPPLFQRLVDYFKSTWAIKLFSLGAAVVMWIALVSPGDIQQRTIPMNVTLQDLPKGLLLDDPVPSEFKVTLSGPADAFSSWPKENQIIRVPIGQMLPGPRKIPLTSSNLTLPPRMKVMLFDPSHVSLTTHRTRTVTVPVVLNVEGRRIASNHMNVQIQPKEVQLVIRREDPGPSMIVTEPANVLLFKPGNKQELKLLLPPKTQLAQDAPHSVQLTIK